MNSDENQHVYVTKDYTMLMNSLQQWNSTFRIRPTRWNLAV